ncbi:hypothetical protein [Hyphobacterium marinum]|uniref:Uncharacterized protein n=1 Tax=Hyphobacterium marinum TaxID=3116574 RepID=A0ABU7LVT3_9PROT|nr:hypothetical protein [Hyphobacterium sp. Y6023]MEE2565663.1 hypothetical protein [Hyphobacterium sp. Y6023]
MTLVSQKRNEMAADGAFDGDPGPQIAVDNSPVNDSVNSGISTSIHKGVAWLFLSLHAALFTVLFATFWGDTDVLFAVVIALFFLCMYLGAPITLLRIRGFGFDGRQSWMDFLVAPFATASGLVSGRSACIQICLIPAAVLVGMSAFCFIISGARP